MDLLEACGPQRPASFLSLAHLHSLMPQVLHGKLPSGIKLHLYVLVGWL